MSLTWIPTNSGLVQRAEEVGEICREAAVPYLVDACQAVGQLAVSPDRLHCDYLAATARKFLRGPRGIGFLPDGSRAYVAAENADTVNVFDDLNRTGQTGTLGTVSATQYAALQALYAAAGV